MDKVAVSGYVLRAPGPGDFLAVVDLLIASELARTGHSTLGADFVSGEWSAPGFDLGADARVMTRKTGAVVGYAQAALEEPNVVDSWGVVHPARRGRGIGTALFDWIEQRAEELSDNIDEPVFRHKTDAGDEGAASILQSRGFRPVRHFWHMQIDLADYTDQTDAGDAAGPAPDSVRITVAGIEDQRATPGDDPTLRLLATYEGEQAGALTMSRADDGAWIDCLDVPAPHRGRGIAGALLRRAFAECAKQGLARVLVSVDTENDTGAAAVYERAGMCVVAGRDAWERTLRAPLPII